MSDLSKVVDMLVKGTEYGHIEWRSAGSAPEAGVNVWVTSNLEPWRFQTTLSGYLIMFNSEDLSRRTFLVEGDVDFMKPLIDLLQVRYPWTDDWKVELIETARRCFEDAENET